jgi:hypothetical protein
VTVHEQSSQQNRSLWHWDNGLVRNTTVVHKWLFKLIIQVLTHPSTGIFSLLKGEITPS